MPEGTKPLTTRLSLVVLQGFLNVLLVLLQFLKAFLEVLAALDHGCDRLQTIRSASQNGQLVRTSNSRRWVRGSNPVGTNIQEWEHSDFANQSPELLLAVGWRVPEVKQRGEVGLPLRTGTWGYRPSSVLATE